MNRRGNPASLAQARRRDSLDKRGRVLTTITALESNGQPVTHAAVARAARVSTWLTYAPGIREHIEAAQTRQARTTPPHKAPLPRLPWLTCAPNSTSPAKRSGSSALNVTSSKAPYATNLASSLTPSTPQS
ncbi:hypothetical protein ACWCXX_41140 [Streptomyces sp. NPDC001732]